MSLWFDTHAHLFLLGNPAGDDALDLRVIEEALEASFHAGIGWILCVGIDAASSQQSLALARQYPGRVFAAVGIHPNSASTATEEDWKLIEELAIAQEVVAIGETGLDWYRDFTPPTVQRSWFERHWELSQKSGKALIIHCRDAEKEVTECLENWQSRGDVRAVMHACAAEWETARRWLALPGVMISFAGSVTYRNTKFAHIRETARHVPLDRLLVETDCPYLVPEPFRGRVRSSIPAYTRQTGEFLAALRGLNSQELARITMENARRIFRLADGP